MDDDLVKLEQRVAALERSLDDPSRKDNGMVLKKVQTRFQDFEAQIAQKFCSFQQDVDKRLTFMTATARNLEDSTLVDEKVSHQSLESLKYQLSEVNDLMTTACNDTNHLKRVVLACERDMEDFTAAMDAVNVDLDEMRAKVDSTHSIMFSRQRVEATVTADISALRLDLVDLQEMLKTHDSWMLDVTASLQEAHTRIEAVQQEASEIHRQELLKLDTKVDVSLWNENNEEIDTSVKTVRDMLSTLRQEVTDNSKTCYDHVETLFQRIITTHQTSTADIESMNEALARAKELTNTRFDALTNNMEEARVWQSKTWQMIDDVGSNSVKECARILDKIQTVEQNGDESLKQKSKELSELIDIFTSKGVAANNEACKKMNALDLRISGLQGAAGEAKRDVCKSREEVNEFKVRLALLDAEMSKSNEEIKQLVLDTKAREQHMAEEKSKEQSVREEVDALVDEFELKGVNKAQRALEGNVGALEGNVAKLSKGLVKLAQILGVFPGTRIEEGTNEVLELDVDLLNWEDICQNMVSRVEKTWRHVSSQKFRSVLDLVSKKADHSVLRLLQISQQHIEAQLDRLRNERELWREAIDKRNIQQQQQQQAGQAVHLTLQSGPAANAPSPQPRTPKNAPASKNGYPSGPSAPFMEVVKVNPSPLAKRVNSRAK